MHTQTSSSEAATQGMPTPEFNLDWPGTLLFSSHLALKGHKLNKFALSLRIQANRQVYLRDEVAYMKAYGISEGDIALVLERDWSRLLLSGGHLQAISKIAAAVGQNLWHIGAHNAGVDVEVLKASCPRRVSGLPKEFE